MAGSLHNLVTWYKITYACEQVAEWDLQNKGRSRWTGTSCIVLEVPLCNLLAIITLLLTHFQRMELRDALRSTKISGNSSSKWNGKESFRNFVSKILVHLSKLSFFQEIWKFLKFPVPFGISTPVWISPSSFSREKLQDGGKSFESKNVRIWFPGKLWTGHSEFPVGEFAWFA